MVLKDDGCVYGEKSQRKRSNIKKKKTNKNMEKNTKNLGKLCGGEPRESNAYVIGNLSEKKNDRYLTKSKNKRKGERKNKTI